MAVAFIFYFMLIEGVSFTVSNALGRFPYMLIFIGNLMVMLYGMMDLVTYTQISMGYGCTRKNSALSLIYMNCMEIFVIEVILGVYSVLVPFGDAHQNPGLTCIFSLALFLFGSGFSMVAGILIHRFGKAAYVIVVLLCTTAGCAVGFVGGFYGGTYVLLDVVMAWPMYALAVGGALWFVLASAVLWLFLRKMEVRV
jgi:hypothetical protein